MKNSALVLFLDRVPLMSVPCEEQGAKRPVFWCVLSLVLFAGILLCAVKTYDSLIESFGIQSSMMLFVWMGVLLVLIFLPSCLPVLFCAAMGVVCGKVYAL